MTQAYIIRLTGGRYGYKGDLYFRTKEARDQALADLQAWFAGIPSQKIETNQQGTKDVSP